MWHEYEFDGKAEKVDIRMELVAREGFLEERGLTLGPDNGYSLGQSL